MSEDQVRMSVTLTADRVTALTVGADGTEWSLADGGAPDLAARPTIDVLRQWLGRWGLFSNLSSRSQELATELGWRADFVHLPVPDTFKVLGEHLYRLAFPGDVGSMFVAAHDEARTTGATLRVVLSIKDAEAERWLADLPWEFLYRPDPNGFFLAAESSFVLSRFLDYREGRADIVPHPLPLKVLSVVAVPSASADVGLDAIRAAAWELAATLQSDPNRVVVESVPWERLAPGRAEGKDVIHVIGVARASGGTMEIDLPGSAGQSEQEIVRLAEAPTPRPAGWQPPRLVVLHLLEANPFDYAATFGDHARALVRKGVPAVLAMQYPMPPGEMVGFATAFYDALSRGTPVDEAVQGARGRFRQQPAGATDRLFGAPVLYLQAADSRLVPPPGPTPAPEPATTPAPVPAPPVETPVRSLRMGSPGDGAVDPLAEDLLAIALEGAPTDQQLFRWVHTTPWSELSPRDAERRIRERLRNEAGRLGPMYEAMLRRVTLGGGPGGQ